uniref:Uncharacterized protein n=1 Tax=Solanum lycopersicum TaxID=4081 RepID=A0A3Q7FA91_SOLLC
METNPSEFTSTQLKQISFNQSHDEQKSLPMNLPRSLENQSPQLAIFPPLGYSVFRDLNNHMDEFSPPSYVLVEEVLEESAVKLHPYLTKAVMASAFPLTTIR